MRVALWEHELREGDDYYTGESIKVHSGLWCGAGPGRQQLDDDQVVRPFALPKIDFRWHDQQEPDKPTDHLAGPLATWWPDRLLVAYDEHLTLVPALRTRVGLRAAPVPGPFDLVDDEGIRGAVLRRWRMRPYSYDYHPPLPLLRGAELLLRPDLATVVRRLRDLRQMTTVTRETRTRREA